MGLDEELGSLAMAASLELLEGKKGEAERPPLKARVKRCHQLLTRRMKVGVSDGRFFVGKFHCLDKQGNIILYDTLECRPIPPSSRSLNKMMVKNQFQCPASTEFWSVLMEQRYFRRSSGYRQGCRCRTITINGTAESWPCAYPFPLPDVLPCRWLS